MLLLCDRWQQRGTLTKQFPTWKCVWSKDLSLSSSMWRKWYQLIFMDACWMFMQTKQWMWAQWGGGWCVFSSGDSDSCSPPLVQVCMSMTWKLLFIASENAQLMVVVMLNNNLCSWEFALSTSGIVLFASAALFVEINRRHYFWNSPFIYLKIWKFIKSLKLGNNNNKKQV